ncbi:histone-like nucleoid-structuring protein Lsr2 [Nocardia sp. NPDC057272]|uniref:Lsr2 family DNA-binding protein n=1 Tax=Nocardia sp. NPDC057272 TaxID=3346079 RepID=UPI0036295390
MSASAAGIGARSAAATPTTSDAVTRFIARTLTADRATQLRSPAQWDCYAGAPAWSASTCRLASKSPAPEPIRRKDLTDIRAWASKNGHTVSTRGRISADVIAANETASA